MNAKRKKVQEYILKQVGQNSKVTVRLMTDMFERMDDKEFHRLMEDIRDGKQNLSYVIPPEEGTGIEEHKLISMLKKMGVDVMQRLTYEDEELGTFTGKIPAIVLLTPVKRASQMVDKKISIAKGNKTSLITGQASGSTKTSKITTPETLINIGFGSNEVIGELLNVRGGNLGALDAMNKHLYENGTASARVIESFSTGVESKKSLKTIFTASHLKSTL